MANRKPRWHPFIRRLLAVRRLGWTQQCDGTRWRPLTPWLLAALVACGGGDGAAGERGAGTRGDDGEAPAPIEITFLDVGQGDAVLVRAPDGREEFVALVDAGRRSPVEALREIGVQRIDLLVASHADSDHIGGMAAVLQAFPVGEFMDNHLEHTTSTYGRLMESVLTKLEDGEIEYLRALPGVRTRAGGRIDVLPGSVEGAARGGEAVGTMRLRLGGRRAGGRGLTFRDQNNRSVALLVRHGEFAALLSGDSEVERLEYLLARGTIPDITLLKAPHHGSRNGVTDRFLAAARPEVVVISVGANNSYGHPMPEALTRYRRAASRPEVYRTDMHGTVTVLGYADGTFEVTLEVKDEATDGADEAVDVTDEAGNGTDGAGDVTDGAADGKDEAGDGKDGAGGGTARSEPECPLPRL